jgi:mRNA interferase MazF
MKKSEIWLADLNPQKGKEQSGARPVVIISGNAKNDHCDLAIAFPLTSQIKNFAGSVCLNPSATNGLKVASEVLTFHVRSIAKERLIKKMGNITKAEMNSIIINLNNVLKY